MKYTRKYRHLTLHLPLFLLATIVSVVLVLGIMYLRSNRKSQQIATAQEIVQIINPSLEIDGDKNKTPDNWERSNLQKTDIMVCNVAYTGSCSFFIGNRKGGYIRRLYQRVPISGVRGTIIAISGWSMANNVIDSGPGSGIFYSVGAFPKKSDGDWIWNSSGSLTATFNLGTHGFEKAETIFTIPEDFSYIEVQFAFGEKGNVWFDDIVLTVIPPQ